jgi:hypothetical protein
MALPASGQITYGQIQIESDIPASPADVNMTGMITTYHKQTQSTSQSPTYFYGITWDIVTSSMGTITVNVNSSTAYDAYRPITTTNMDGGNLMQITVTTNITAAGAGSWTYYYSINSTSAWTQIRSGTGTAANSNYTIASPISYTDVLRVRVYTTHSSVTTFTGNITIANGVYSSGGGAWSVSGTYSWSWTE